MGSAVGAILSFLGKAVGFLVEHTWALIVFVARRVGWWLMQKVKKRYFQLVHINEANIKSVYDLFKVIQN